MLLQDFNLEYQNVSKTLQVPKQVVTGFQPGVSKRIKNTAHIWISTWSIKTYQKLAVSKHVFAGFQPGVSKRIKNTARIKKISENDPSYQKKQKNVSKRIKTYQNVSETLFVSKIGRIKKHGRSDTLGRIKNVFDMISGVSKNQNICKINGSDLPRIRNF